jgi:protoporphyrinogen oxidase
MENTKNPVVIVGAGIAGCVIGHRLASNGRKVILIEKEKQVGGLARTFRYGDFAFDIGPHRFFTAKPEVLSYIRGILKDGCHLVQSRSSIYFLGEYYSWPLRPISLFKLPARFRLSSMRDLLSISLRAPAVLKDDFENYILDNYGSTLYNIFFKEYTRKFLNRAPGDIHADWAKHSIMRTLIDEKIAHNSLFDILKLFLRPSPVKTRFIYPEDGIDVFCRNLAAEITDRYGGYVLCGTQISDVKHGRGVLEEVSFGGLRVSPDEVVWTGKLGDLCGLLDVDDPGLEYLSLIVFNLEVDRPFRPGHQWCYYGNQEVFSRVSTPSLFSKNMSPFGEHGLCVEVTCRERDNVWEKPEALTDAVIRDLQKVGLLRSRAEVRGIHIEKVANAYPVYVLDYQQKLKTVMRDLSRFANLTLAGRSGLFWYNNMDDSIENGIAVAEQIMQGAKEKALFSC